MKIQVLGKGCPNCKKLEENAKKATKDKEIEVEKVYDLAEASKMGMTKAPGLAIDGKLKVQGRIPSPEEIRELVEDE